MATDNLLRPKLIALDIDATRLSDMAGSAAQLLARYAGMSEAAIAGALAESIRTPGFAIGAGVAVPHADLENVPEHMVAFVRTRAGIAIESVDGVPADLFFVLLARRDDPREHLHVLARLARLAQSRVLLRGLRGAQSAEEVIDLVHVAEARGALNLVPAPPPPQQERQPATGEQLVVVSVAGEQTVDRLLVALIEAGLDHASIVDGESLEEAATKEIPLFSGFGDLFGDPGGRRVILARVSTERAQEILQMVRQLCETYPPKAADVHILPVHESWTYARAKKTEAAKGH